MKHLIAFSAAFSLLAATSLVASAQDNSAVTLEPQGFVEKAAGSNAFEIQSSQLALQKTQSDKVKEIAQTMIDDHTKAGKDLADAASKDNLKVPEGLPPEMQQKLDALNAAEANQFDAAYLSAQTTAHEEAVNLFGAYAQQGPDGAVKTFAAQTLPALKMHLTRVQSATAQ